jgi:hypothetical protein
MPITIDQLPKTVAWVAGASAAVSVIAFMVMPWPWGLLVIPALLVWSLPVSAFCAPMGRKRPGRVLALLGFCALVLGGVVGGLLHMIS